MIDLIPTLVPISHQETRRIGLLDIAEFDGLTHDPEVYIEWEASLDKYFEFKDIPLKGNTS